MARSVDVPDQPGPGDAPRKLPSGSPRGDRSSELDDSAEPRAADRPALRDPPAAWSREDLRNRLEHLAPGHPSSLRRADLDRNPPGDESDQDTGRPPADETDHDDSKPPDKDPDTVSSRYWDEVPRLQKAWEDHLRRWPAGEAPPVDRSHDPAGSWRGDGNQYLDPEQHAQAKDAIAVMQQSEEKLTECMKGIEQENASGGRLGGLEFCRKSDDRIKEKMAEQLEHQPDRTPSEAGQEINDAIRYTFCFELRSYADGYREVKERLEAKMCRMIYSKNHWWADPEYKGVNTRWMAPDGQRFEVQFHTGESFHAKHEITHTAYERSRNPLTRRAERLELDAFQQKVCSFLSVPNEVGSILDYKEEER